MKPVQLLLAVTAAGIGAICAFQAIADGNFVAFPNDHSSGVHYATVNRGNVREELFTSPAAIEALKAGLPAPNGTVITVEDYRSDELYRYIVMEKRTGWGSQHPPELRTGEWEFQWFNPDRTPRAGENLDRCRSCHASQSSQDFLFTADRMRAAR